MRAGSHGATNNGNLFGFGFAVYANVPRILLIDDSKNDLAVVRTHLARSGHQVLEANSGEAGLAAAREQAPDVIMVDFRMPGMDGREFCRIIKSDEALRTIPVIMLTGAGQPEDVVQGLAAGADDYVTKSADPQVLMARIATQLRMKAYQDQIRHYNTRVQNDMKIARKIQEALLPDPEFRTGDVEIRSAYIPSEQLSGDFYDYVPTDGLLYLMVADVSGHGLPAAILVSLLKSYLHTEATEGSSPSMLLARLNDFLHSASLPAQYATAQLFRFEKEHRMLRYANAAHPPFLLHRKGQKKTELLEQPGHLLGMMPGMKYDESAVETAPGDVLFSYTDGLTDRRNAGGEFYSLDRIAAILEKNDSSDFGGLYQKIFEDVSAFAPSEEFRDDVAFILARLG